MIPDSSITYPRKLSLETANRHLSGFIFKPKCSKRPKLVSHDARGRPYQRLPLVGCRWINREGLHRSIVGKTVQRFEVRKAFAGTHKDQKALLLLSYARLHRRLESVRTLFSDQFW